MNIRRSVALGSLGLALCAAGCSKPVEPEAPSDPEPAPVAEPAAEEEEEVEPVAPEPEPPKGPTAETVPIPEDFAEEMSKEITANNYTEQLAAMKKELEK